MNPMSFFIKKSISFLCVSVFIVPAFFLGIGTTAAQIPEGFSFSSPESLGLSAISAEKTDSVPILDGTVSSGEYTNKNILTPSHGLVFSTEDSYEVSEDKKTALRNVVETVSVSYDDRYFYVAMELFDPNGAIAPYSHALYGEVFSVVISLGASPNSDLLSRQAVLKNCYYFLLDSPSAVAVSGIRLQKRDGVLKNVLQISSSAKTLQNNGFSDDEKILWNGEKYCKEAVYTLDGERSKFSFECRIPIGDVLLSLDENERREALSALKREEAFFGSFLSQISVNSLSDSAPLCVTSGILTKSVCPFSNVGESWNEAFVSDFGIAKSVANTIDWLMMLLSFGGKTENGGTGNAIAPADGEPFGVIDDNKENVQNSTPPTVTTKRGNADFLAGQGALEDESVFDDLPDVGDILPEHTEIIPIESEAEKGESENIFGSTLPFLAGVLMLTSVFLIAFIFFKRENQEKNAKNTKKKT